MPQVQEFRAIAAQLAGQLGGGDALGEATDNQDQFAWPALDAAQGRAGEGVEDGAAARALVVEDRGAVAAVDAQAALPPALRAGQAAGVEAADEPVIARLFV